MAERGGRDQFASNNLGGGGVRPSSNERTNSFTSLSLSLSLAPVGNFPAHLSLSPLLAFLLPLACLSVRPSVHVGRGRISFFAKVSLALARPTLRGCDRCCRSGSGARHGLTRNVSPVRLGAFVGLAVEGGGESSKRSIFLRRFYAVSSEPELKHGK